LPDAVDVRGAVIRIVMPAALISTVATALSTIQAVVKGWSVTRSRQPGAVACR
jgi:hypothetical protein